MNKICVLLNGPINNDHRVIKMINTLSQKHSIDLYYLAGSDQDKLLFDEKVDLFSFDYSYSLRTRIIRHSFFWHEFNFFIKSVLDKKIAYNTIWCNDFPTLYPACKIAKKLNSNLIYDSHEIYLETLNQFFPTKTSLIKSLIFKTSLGFMRTFGKMAEKRLINKANQIITVNESLADYFKNTYGVNNVDVIMNFPPITRLESTQFIDFRALFSFQENDKILIYQGVLNKGRGLELIINAIKHIPEHVKLIILGDGPLKSELTALTSDLILEKRIKFLNKVPINELLNYTSGADFGINILEDFNLSKKLASPNKLFEYIHAGIPVVCSRSVENDKVLNKYKIGVAVHNEPVDIAKKITELIEKELGDYKLACEHASKEYNWQSQEKAILNLITTHKSATKPS